MCTHARVGRTSFKHSLPTQCSLLGSGAGPVYFIRAKHVLSRYDDRPVSAALESYLGLRPCRHCIWELWLFDIDTVLTSHFFALFATANGRALFAPWNQLDCFLDWGKVGLSVNFSYRTIRPPALGNMNGNSSCESLHRSFLAAIYNAWTCLNRPKNFVDDTQGANLSSPDDPWSRHSILLQHLSYSRPYGIHCRGHLKSLCNNRTCLDYSWGLVCFEFGVHVQTSLNLSIHHSGTFGFIGSRIFDHYQLSQHSCTRTCSSHEPITYRRGGLYE